MVLRRVAWVFFLLVLLTSIAPVIQGRHMPLAEIEIGMEGYAKTVFTGTEITAFPVTVKGVLQQGYNRQLILIYAGGPDIERIGGVASGMSGSPVYLDERIAGAIAYGWRLSDQRYALVTPIEEMMDIFTMERKLPRDEEPDLHKMSLGTLAMERVMTPVFASGFSKRALNLVKKTFAPYNVEVLSGPGMQSVPTVDREVFEPGSALAVELMRGDMRLAFIGTLTHIIDNRILAFGHPLLNVGDVDFFMSHAYIHDIIPSIEFPFKLASPLDLKGMIKQDRGAGIGGILGEFPSVVPVRLTVTDTDLQKTNRANLQIIKDETLLPALVTAGALELLDETLDRIGPGTALVSMEIHGLDLPNRLVTRKNYYHSHYDIAMKALDELRQLLAVLVTNPYKGVGIFNINLEVEVNSRNMVAFIQDVKLEGRVFAPGDELEATVLFLPYRDEPIQRQVSFVIPADSPLGGASLVFSGGPTWAQIVPKENDNDDITYYYYQDFNEFITDFEKRPMNNQLVVELHPYYYPAREEGEGEGEDWRERPEFREIFDTDFVLDGYWSMEIEIRSPQADEPDGEEADLKTEAPGDK